MMNCDPLHDKIILGCQKGGRSRKAARLLVENGFTNIYDMRGGIQGETDPFGNIQFAGWATRGMPTTIEFASCDILT